MRLLLVVLALLAVGCSTPPSHSCCKLYDENRCYIVYQSDAGCVQACHIDASVGPSCPAD